MKKRFLPLALSLSFTLNLFSQVWSPQAANTLPSNFSVMNVSIANDQVAWAIALDYNQWGIPVPSTHILKVLRTTDGGANWSVKEMTQAPGKMTIGIWALDENTAIFSTLNFQNSFALFRTTDGGDTWTQVLSGPAGGGRVVFFNAQEGVSCNIGAAMARTSDGGQTWTLLAPNTNYPPFLAGEDYLNVPTGWSIVGDTLWTGTTKGRVYKSTDRGLSWTVHQATNLNTYIGSMAFSDGKNGLALTGDFNNPPLKLIRTVDGGVTWVDIGNSNNLTEVLAIPCTNSMMGVSYFDNSTFLSKDLGTSWELLNNTIKPAGPAFLTPEIGWITNGGATGPNPALYKWDGGELYGRTFVNKNATGTNDGSSWADAYTDLQAALAAAEAGDEIWVAEGTYLPGSDPAATFLINKNLKLYGGFAGTECNLSERDIVAHPTTLSGDVNGDDVEDDFVNFKADNVMTVVTINANITNETVVDGFTIRNGYADGTISTNSEQNGGGVYSTGSPHFKNCILKQNYAILGGGALGQNANTGQGLSLENCVFEKNRANSGGGARVISTNFLIDNCIFRQNESFDGAFQANEGGLGIVNSSGTVRNCFFIENHAFDFAGGMGIWNPAGTGNSEVEVIDCTFNGNSSNLGVGGLSFLSFGSNTTYTAEGCSFIGNSSAFGSGISITSNTASSNTSFIIDSCNFSQNSAERGGAIAAELDGSGVNLELHNSIFDGNNTTVDYATAYIWTFSPSTAMPGTVVVDNCIFQNNNSIFTGGLDIGSGQDSGPFDFTISNCSFLNNHADRYCGGFDIWGDGGSKPTFTIENCLVEGNSADERGGGMWILTSSQDFKATMKNCRILNNQSPKGASIAAFLSELNVFDFPTNAQLKIENSLISGSTGDVAIELDSFPDFQMLNCTIADNNGGGIQLSDQSSMSLQNTILANPGHTEYTAATPDVTATSNGGNLVLDSSLNASLTALDKPGTAPDFMSGTYEPSATSPLVNAGVNAGVSATTDLAGNERIQQGIVDIGAFESPFVSAAREVVIGEISLTPNPASDLLYLALPDNAAPTSLAVFDAQGRLVLSQKFTAGDALQVGHLPDGFFTVKVTDGERVFVGKFIKQ